MNEMSEFKGVGLTGVGLTRVDCINVKAYFVLSAIYYIQSVKSQFRQNFMKIK